MKNLLFLLLLLSSSVGASSLLDDPWGPQSEPGLMSYTFLREFDRLPLKGNAQKGTRFWSGDYWPNHKGSINQRWFSSGAQGFNLSSPSKNEALSMSLSELARLSPSEKYDIFVGRYDYPLKKEVERIANPNAQEWEGICDGWAPASLNHSEPVARTVINRDGIQVPFGSSDIKALLSYYYAYGFQVENHQMGTRCERGGFLNRNKNCHDDLNAGAFHIALTNKIGLLNEGLIADVDRFKEVWNQPVVSYHSTILADNLSPLRSSARDTVKEVKVETVMTYIDEADNSWDPIGAKTKTAQVIYRLEINAYGQIVGGTWLSKWRPDFLWLKSPPSVFTGNLARLRELLPKK